MPNKIKTSFRINKSKILCIVKKYPLISQIIKPQIESLIAVKKPPLIEQVHPIIYWLHRYSENCEQRLLMGCVDVWSTDRCSIPVLKVIMWFEQLDLGGVQIKCRVESTIFPKCINARLCFFISFHNSFSH